MEIFKNIKLGFCQELKKLELPIKESFVENKFDYPCVFTNINIDDIEELNDKATQYSLEVEILIHTPKRDSTYLFEKADQLNRLFKTYIKIPVIGNVNIVDKESKINIDECFYYLSLSILFNTYSITEYDKMLHATLNDENV